MVDFIEMAAANRFWKTKVPWRKAPENIRLEGGARNDVLEASIDSVEIVPGIARCKKALLPGTTEEPKTATSNPG